MSGMLTRVELQEIAEETLKVIQSGTFTVNGVTYDLTPGLTEARDNAKYYPAACDLSTWEQHPWPPYIVVRNQSTLEAAHQMYLEGRGQHRIGVLNFANAVYPGGGFLRGSAAQEESIARSSTLYPTLITNETKQYYEAHEKTSKTDAGFSSPAMIFSPGVEVFRSHDGKWTEPFPVDVLTCAAVNAIKAGNFSRLSKGQLEKAIYEAMYERMGRLLFLFEQKGMKEIVLGSFGTGAFGCDVEMVSKIWVDLLIRRGARFKRSFDHVVFAILGKETLEEFSKVFDAGLKKVSR